MFSLAEEWVRIGVEWLRLIVESIGAVIIAIGIVVALRGLLHHWRQDREDQFNPVRLAFARYLAMARGRKPGDLAEVLRVSTQTVYSWSHAWRDQGLIGLLNGHKGGRPRQVTDEQIATAVALVEAEPLRLKELASRVAQAHPDCPPVSVDRLAVSHARRAVPFPTFVVLFLVWRDYLKEIVQSRP